MTDDTGTAGTARGGGPGADGGRRRGRRPAGEDTRATLLNAARTVFVEHGFTAATVRMIASRADVDPAMVNHWFGGKAALFAAAMELPINLADVVQRLLHGDRAQLGERLVRTFLGVWDASDGGAFVVMLRSATSHEAAAAMLRDFISTVLFGPLARGLGVDQPELRAVLCGSQMAGVGLLRYVLRLEPLASADADTLVAAIAPNLQRYLTADLRQP